MAGRFIDALVASLPIIMEVVSSTPRAELIGDRPIGRSSRARCRGRAVHLVVTGRQFGGVEQMLIDCRRLTDGRCSRRTYLLVKQ